MKQFLLVLLLAIVLALPGCGTVPSDDDASETVYHSDTSAEDCYLCGGKIETLIPFYWGQNNIALISLNTFDIKPIEINRYDRQSGQLIEEYAGVASFGGSGSIDGGFSASVFLNYDRGYATGTMEFWDDEKLDKDKISNFLCSDCLNELLSYQIGESFGVGAINLDTKEIRIFEERAGGFTLGDFYVDCDLKDGIYDTQQMSISVFYCPVRYEKEP